VVSGCIIFNKERRREDMDLKGMVGLGPLDDGESEDDDEDGDDDRDPQCP
jgi:hypothetical protein